jgi:hypothetical protein
MRLLLEFCRDVDDAWEDWGKGSAYFAVLEFGNGSKARHWSLSAFPFAFFYAELEKKMSDHDFGY